MKLINNLSIRRLFGGRCRSGLRTNPDYGSGLWIRITDPDYGYGLRILFADPDRLNKDGPRLNADNFLRDQIKNKNSA